MVFHIQVRVDKGGDAIKKECLEVLARFFQSKGLVFDVGYNPNELDLDNIGKA